MQSAMIAPNTMSMETFQQNGNQTDLYSPSRIIDEASKKVSEGDLQGAEMLYQEALLDWVDDAREGNDANNPDKMKNAIAELWCGYATYFFKLKKFKSCHDTYENATQCPISGSCGKIWRAYADFCRVRKKPRKAQAVYLRALAGNDKSEKGAVTNETERFKLWNDFLSLTRESTNDPSLTIDALMTAVKEEHNNAKSETNTITSNQQSLNSISSERPHKIQKTHHIEHSISSSTLLSSNNVLASVSLTDQKTSMISNINNHNIQPSILNLSLADQIQVETKKLISVTKGSLPPELRALWLASDGDAPPARPEPPLFAPSPPKLSDVSGKDILGSEMALKLLRILLNTKESNIILDVCRGCWVMTALKEQEIVNVIKQFEEHMSTELETLEKNLAARLAIAGPALEMAVNQTNDAERNEVMAKWNQRRQQMVDSISWEFRKLLAIQQNMLTAAKIPGFQGATIDPITIALQSKICSVMHSAFFLRNRIDEKTHLAMLKKLEEKLSKESITLPPPPPSAINSISFPPPHQQQQVPNLAPPPFPQQLPPPPPPHVHNFHLYTQPQHTMFPPPPPPTLGTFSHGHFPLPSTGETIRNQIPFAQKPPQQQPQIVSQLGQQSKKNNQSHFR